MQPVILEKCIFILPHVIALLLLTVIVSMLVKLKENNLLYMNDLKLSEN